MKKTKILLVGALLFGVPSVALSVNHQFNDATVVRAETKTVKATVKNTSSVTIINPIEGVSFAYSQTFNTAMQITKNNSSTLTISNGDEYKLVSLKLTMKSNKSSGAGSLSYTTSENKADTYLISNSTYAKGWSTHYTQSYETIEVTLSSSISLTSSFSLKISATTSSLYIQSYEMEFEPTQVASGNKIQFNSNGGTTIPTQYVENNNLITKPTTDPTKDGYIFGGWYYNDSLWDFTTPVTGAMVLTAKWNNLDITNISECNTDGEYYRITGLVTSNYANDSYSIQDERGAILLNDTSSLLTKSYVGNTISITGKLAKNSDGNLELNNLLEIENNDTELTINPITNLSSITNNDYAKKVSLKNLKIKSISGQEATINKSDYIDLYFETKSYISNYDSKTFNNLFSVNSYVNVEGFVNIVNSKLKICLTRISKSTTYTATFVYNNGDKDTTQIVSEEEKFTKPVDPKKDADAKYTYTFDDWYTGENGTGEKYNFDNEPKDITLYANWIKIAKPINETFKDAEIKSNLKFGYTKTIEKVKNNAKKSQFDFVSMELKDTSEVNQFSNDDYEIEFSNGGGNNITPKYYSNGTAIRVYTNNTITIKGKNNLIINSLYFDLDSNKDGNLLVNNEKDISFDAKDTNLKIENLGKNEITINVTSGQIRIKNLIINDGSSNEELIEKASYSNFYSLQLQYQYTFDVSDAENVEEVGIFVTDDVKYDFYETGEFSDDFPFDEMLLEGTHGYKFINKEKKETYTVGINIPEINLTTVDTKFSACPYVKTNGKYYFATNEKKNISIYDMINVYLESENLDNDTKNIIKAFHDYIFDLKA